MIGKLINNYNMTCDIILIRKEIMQDDSGHLKLFPFSAALIKNYYQNFGM